jgi:hypothetical protein
MFINNELSHKLRQKIVEKLNSTIRPKHFPPGKSSNTNPDVVDYI